jgi:hypothetical protein
MKQAWSDFKIEGKLESFRFRSKRRRSIQSIQGFVTHEVIFPKALLKFKIVLLSLNHTSEIGGISWPERRRGTTESRRSEKCIEFVI